MITDSDFHKDKSNCLIAFVGLCGSGKSEASSILGKKGFFLVKVDDLIQDELLRRRLPNDDLSQKKMRDELRELHGKDALVALLFETIDKTLDSADVVIDGMYSWDEYISLKKRYGDKLKVFALSCPKDMRYSRLERRSGRALEKNIAELRDISEIENLNKGGPIAIADYTIINDGSIDELGYKIKIGLSHLKGDD